MQVTNRRQEKEQGTSWTYDLHEMGNRNGLSGLDKSTKQSNQC